MLSVKKNEPLNEVFFLPRTRRLSPRLNYKSRSGIALLATLRRIIGLIHCHVFQINAFVLLYLQQDKLKLLNHYRYFVSTSKWTASQVNVKNQVYVSQRSRGRDPCCIRVQSQQLLIICITQQIYSQGLHDFFRAKLTLARRCAPALAAAA